MRDEKIKEGLLKVIDLLNKGFTKGTLARDINNNPCDPKNPKAIKFSVLGAILSVNEQLYDYVQYLVECNFNELFIELVNDKYTSDEIINLLKRGVKNL